MNRPRVPTLMAARAGAVPARRGRRPRHVRKATGRCTRQRQRGSITAETAVTLPTLVIVLAVALWGVSTAAAQVACLDAARAGARAAARGEPQTQVRAAVLRAVPPHARVTINRNPNTTRVVVKAESASPLKGLFPALKLEAQAIAATEPRTDTPAASTPDDPPAPEDPRFRPD